MATSNLTRVLPLPVNIAALVIVLVFAGCGGGGAPEAPEAAADAPVEMRSPVRFWQSYRGSPPGVHIWTESDEPYTVEKMPTDPDAHSVYGFISDDGKLMYSINDERGLIDAGALKALGYVFRFNRADSAIEACRGGTCIQAPITAPTSPYVFTEKNGAVLVLTRWGDALLFRDGAWCRMTRTGDTYRCAAPEPAMLAAPTGIQFYTAVEYRGKVLIGEFPTGRLYEFNGSELFPSTMTPPKFADGAMVGYEAQTLAEYCGDLFAGYWPKGEIYRFDHKTGQWSLFRRLFDSYSGEPFVPHEDRPADGLVFNFYGQRVTALLPHGDSLYAVTSNKGGWTAGTPVSAHLSAAQQAQYGAAYRIKRAGCRTEYHQ